MCFAGIEDEVKNLVEKVAAKAEVHALDARIDHGHLHVLVENRGWMRSTDLLEQHSSYLDDNDFAVESVPVRHVKETPAFASR